MHKYFGMNDKKKPFWEDRMAIRGDVEAIHKKYLKMPKYLYYKTYQLIYFNLIFFYYQCALFMLYWTAVCIDVLLFFITSSPTQHHSL